MTAGAVAGVLAMGPAPAFQAIVELIATIKVVRTIAPVGELATIGMGSVYVIIDSLGRTAAKLRVQISVPVEMISLAMTKRPV